MKFIKADGTLEEGTPLTDEQATEMQKTEEVLHAVVCRNAYHYDWQGVPQCRKVANDVALGASLFDSLERLIPKLVPDVKNESVVDSVSVEPEEVLKTPTE